LAMYSKIVGEFLKKISYTPTVSLRGNRLWWRPTCQQ